MAEAIPSGLRQADPNIYKTASRAAQLQSVKPIVAYWCEYWVLKQILAKGLHNSDPEILEYSTHLMDKLEQTKSEYPTEEAISDDTAGQAYVEQFAQETLDRAQRVVKAGKVTAQTANTFDAAASFFGLVNVWGPPDAENLQKIKYAKWNATRILKALKDGTDPNESNPKLEDLPPPDAALDDVDAAPTSPDISAPAPAAPTVPRPVTIEDEPDRDLRRDSAGISLPHTPVSAVSNPLEPPTAPTNVPGTAAAPDSPPISLPQVPSGAPPAPEWVPTPSPPAQQQAPFLPPQQPAPPTQPAARPPPEPYYQQPPQQPPQSYLPPAAPATYSTGQAPPPSAYAPPAATGYPPPTSYRSAAPPPAAPQPAVIDDAAVAAAQKHAKWAISALNFEDVSTAVKELQKALQVLGAS